MKAKLKSIINMLRKRFFILILSGLVIISMTCVTSAAADSNGLRNNDIPNNEVAITQTPKVSVQAADTSASCIGKDAAKRAALADAGLSASEVTFIKSAQDTDDGTVVYGIEFYTDTHEYDYEINAVSGEIVEKDKEALKARTSPSNAIPAESASYIGEDAAKQTALADAGLSAQDVTFIKAVLDTDDGITAYEIEFYSGADEYEYEIDAVSGQIAERSVECRITSDDGIKYNE